VLAPRHQPGDAYRLSLRVSTRTESSRGGKADPEIDEDVHLDYTASVRVLEVDAEGRPVRERHDGVRLSFERPGETGSLFKEGASFEVRRPADVQVFVAGARMERAVEKVVSDILERQLLFTLEPALVDPRRRVEVGASWSLDPSLARRLLLGRGLRVMEFGPRGSATLERRWREDVGMELVVEYQVPVKSFELTRMPAFAEASSSEARLEGQIRLGPEAGAPPIAWTSSLSLRLSGTSTAPGATQGAPWTMRSSMLVEQTSAPIATATGGAEPAPR
jgi:hypothetical protein